MGDVPIYVAHDSADVWAHQELFRLDDQARPTVVAGVPPDYFSATGQLGETLSTVGMCSLLPVTGGGSIVFGHLENYSISCDWITSAVSRPIGRFPPARPRQTRASG